MAQPVDPTPSSISRHAPWLLIGCSVLVVGSLSACLFFLTILRLTNGEPFVALLARFRPSSEMLPPTTPTTELLFQDDFKDNRTGWISFSDPTGQMRFTGSRLQLTVSGPNRDIGAVAPPSFDDFRLELDSGLLDGPNETRYGIIFRHQDNQNFYQFEIDGLGQYRIGKVVAGAYVPLTTPKPSSLIQAGQALNRLQVVAVGSSFRVFVNGAELDEVNDTTFASGHIGVYTRIDGTGTSHAVFGNLRVYRP